MNIFKEQIVINNNTINIRLAGDGTSIGSNMTVLNFSFGFLDVIDNKVQTNPNSVTGNFTIGLFRVKSECYNELKVSLKELVESLSELKTISIDGLLYNIDYWLSGDLKFLALVLGRFVRIVLYIYICVLLT